MPFRLPSGARPDGLTLRTRDASRLLDFYRRVLGLPGPGSGAARRSTVAAGSAGDPAAGTVVLVEEPDAPLRPRDCVGLYHFALLYPDRPALARAVARVLDAGWERIDGAADHGVSEAFYLRDPEGNGVELYRDRDPSRWPRNGGEVAMTTDPLDLDELLAEARDGSEGEPAADGSAGGEGPGRDLPVLGHLHLHTADLGRARSFHVDALGLRVRQSTYPGALFLAAGDYHHHLGLNVWAGRRRAPDGATGLLGYRWSVPGDALRSLGIHLDDLGVAHLRRDGDVVLEDPDGTEVVVREGNGPGRGQEEGPG